MKINIQQLIIETNRTSQAKLNIWHRNSKTLWCIILLWEFIGRHFSVSFNIMFFFCNESANISHSSSNCRLVKIIPSEPAILKKFFIIEFITRHNTESRLIRFSFLIKVDFIVGHKYQSANNFYFSFFLENHFNSGPSHEHQGDIVDWICYLLFGQSKSCLTTSFRFA